MTTKAKSEFTTRLAAPADEFSPEFVQAMANRMAVSFHKYGAVADAHASCDHIASLQKRLSLYAETGNTEWLADVANFAMMEYMKNPGAFRATDSDESPGRVRSDGTTDTERNN